MRFKGLAAHGRKVLTVSTELVTPAHVGSDYTYSAMVQVFHNGKLYGEYKLDIPLSGIIYQTGNVPLGHVSFTLLKDGKVTVRLLIGTVYDSGVGCVPGLIEKDIYVR